MNTNKALVAIAVVILIVSIFSVLGDRALRDKINDTNDKVDEIIRDVNSIHDHIFGELEKFCNMHEECVWNPATEPEGEGNV